MLVLLLSQEAGEGDDVVVDLLRHDAVVVGGTHGECWGWEDVS